MKFSGHIAAPFDLAGAPHALLLFNVSCAAILLSSWARMHRDAAPAKTPPAKNAAPSATPCQHRPRCPPRNPRTPRHSSHARTSKPGSTASCPMRSSSGDIAGAVVVVVKDGQVLTEKGYGYADVEQAHAGRSRAHAVPSGLGLQAVHLDGGDAAGRAGQARPRRGRQHRTSTSRFRRATASRSRCATS